MPSPHLTATAAGWPGCAGCAAHRARCRRWRPLPDLQAKAADKLCFITPAAVMCSRAVWSTGNKGGCSRCTEERQSRVARMREAGPWRSTPALPIRRPRDAPPMLSRRWRSGLCSAPGASSPLPSSSSSSLAAVCVLRCAPGTSMPSRRCGSEAGRKRCGSPSTQVLSTAEAVISSSCTSAGQWWGGGRMSSEDQQQSKAQSTASRLAQQQAGPCMLPTTSPADASMQLPWLLAFPPPDQGVMTPSSCAPVANKLHHEAVQVIKQIVLQLHHLARRQRLSPLVGAHAAWRGLGRPPPRSPAACGLPPPRTPQCAQGWPHGRQGPAGGVWSALSSSLNGESSSSLPGGASCAQPQLRQSTDAVASHSAAQHCWPANRSMPLNC